MPFSGFYKCEFEVNGTPGRSVMYVRDGQMLGGNSAFAHIGAFRETSDGIVADIAIQRHNPDPAYRSLLGRDDGAIHVTGRADGARYRFEGGGTNVAGISFRSVMTPIQETTPPVGAIGEGGIRDGLYSIHLRMLDGVGGGNTGVMLLSRGRILGGDAFFYYLGSYTSAQGRWKGEMLNQEHTPAHGENAIFGGHEVGIGFTGTCDPEGAQLDATALVGKRSVRFAAVMSLVRPAE